MPHMDTVDSVMRLLEKGELEKLKNVLIHILIDKKVLDKGRFLGMDIIVVFDGTGIHSFTERHCDSCLSTTTQSTLTFSTEAKTALKSQGIEQGILECLKKLKSLKFKEKVGWQEAFKNKLGRSLSEKEAQLIREQASIKLGTTSYSHKVLEAKLVCSNGFAISLGSEWIENEVDGYDKQDCEASAFKRLSESIKSDFPRLNICVVVDGLYPNEPFFVTCKENNWRFICTFKDGNLPSLQAKVEEQLSLNKHNTRVEELQIGGEKINRVIRWINGLDYRGIPIAWVECVETTVNSKNTTTVTRFVYLASTEIKYSTAMDYVKAGRLRQKIENEGFNTQKNGGYALEHKYSRVSPLAMKNYYQCLQIAHLINQLCLLSQTVKKQLREWKTTLKHCWVSMISFLIHGNINEENLARFLSKPIQYRYFYLL